MTGMIKKGGREVERKILEAELGDVIERMGEWEKRGTRGENDRFVFLYTSSSFNDPFKEDQEVSCISLFEGFQKAVIVESTDDLPEIMDELCLEKKDLIKQQSRPDGLIEFLFNYEEGRKLDFIEHILLDLISQIMEMPERHRKHFVMNMIGNSAFLVGTEKVREIMEYIFDKMDDTYENEGYSNFEEWRKELFEDIDEEEESIEAVEESQ